MAYEVSCEQLGVAGCDFVARGDTPGAVVEQMVKHLEDKHDMKMPQPDEILGGFTGQARIFEDVDEGALLVVKRLREALEIDMPQDVEAPVAEPPPQKTPALPPNLPH